MLTSCGHVNRTVGSIWQKPASSRHCCHWWLRWINIFMPKMKSIIRNWWL